jgi:hypothetical protein
VLPELARDAGLEFFAGNSDKDRVISGNGSDDARNLGAVDFDGNGRGHARITVSDDQILARRLQALESPESAPADGSRNSVVTMQFDDSELFKVPRNAGLCDGISRLFQEARQL